MRVLLALTMIFTLAACGKSKYRPGAQFTTADVTKDRQAQWQPMKRADQSESNETPRVEKVVIPQARNPKEASKFENVEIEFLLNQMKVKEPKISVGENAGLVQLSGLAIVDDKSYEVKLEGHLEKNSTASLIKVVDGGDERFRAEVICIGEIEEGYYGCDSLVVDIFFKVSDRTIHREQFLLEDEKAKETHSQPTPAPVNTPSKKEEPQKVPESEDELADELDDEGDHADIPEPKGTFVGRPERVLELFELTEIQQPVVESIPQDGNTQASAKNTTPSPSVSGSSQQKVVKPTATPIPPKATPTSVVTPMPKVTPRPTAQPTPKATPKPVRSSATPQAKSTPTVLAAPVTQVTPAPKAQPKATPTVLSTPKPSPRATATPSSTTVVVNTPAPAQVIIDANDEPNRPVDQAVGAYAAGRLQGASTLEFNGQHHYFSRPEQKQNYGTYDLARVVKLFAREVFTRIFPGIKIRINDFSAQKGGKLPPHKGHQNGLEADIGYLTTQSANKVPQHVVTKQLKWLGTMKMKEMWEAFKFLGQSERVSLIWVNKTIKPHICTYAKQNNEQQTAGGSLTLRKIQGISGHTSHFHLRMECGRHNPRCRTDGPPAKTTGC